MFKQLSLRQRIMALALIPTLTISLLLGTTFTLTRLQDLEQELQSRAQLITEQLAPLAAQTLEQSPPERQQQILRRTLEQPDVRAASLYDRHGQLIGHSGPQMLGAAKASERGLTEEIDLLNMEDSFRILRPLVSYSGFFLDRVAQPHQLHAPERQRVGWLEIEFSRDNNQVKTYQTFLASGLLVQAGILLNILLALTLGRKITHPIAQLLTALKKIREEGADGKPLEVRSTGELQELSEEIDALIIRMHSAQQELLSSIDQTTADLKETLESLEVNNVELDLARRSAQQASRTKSEFLANMSHELRTPLNSMIGFTRLLKRSELTEHQQDYLATIHSSAEGLLAMLNSILDFSKLEAGKLELDHSPFNLRELIEQVLTLLAPSAHEKNLELICLIYSDVPLELESDPLRLKQVLTNLVNNAIKFTDSGQVCVRVMLESEKNNQKLIKVSVSDTGIGIAPQQVKQLFRAFAQADPSRTRRIGGTGLGLVISKGLVEMMRGEMGVESTPDQGATFWFNFWAQSASEPTGAVPLPCQGQHTLLFEANPLACSSYQHQLGLHQLQVESCQAVEELQQRLLDPEHYFSLVVISYTPALLSQAELLQLQAQVELKQSALVVLCSTKEEPAIEQLLAPYPQAYCLVKPLTLGALNRALAHLMPSSHRGIREEKRRAPTSTPVEEMPPERYEAPKILAVDDNLANLKLVRILLSELGAKVDIATGGESALQKAQEFSYDLVLLDIQMPDLDGLSVTRKIRQRQGPNQHSPIIALTAHALSEEKRQLLQVGMNAYLTKPVDEYQLKQVIEHWTGKKLPRLPNPPVFHAQAQTEIAADHEEIQQACEFKLIDQEEGQRLAGGKADLADELLQMLLQSLPETLESIRVALAANDYSELLEQVHKLHGATRYCGVPRLRASCEKTETQLKAKSPQASAQVTLLLAEIKALQNA